MQPACTRTALAVYSPAPGVTPHRGTPIPKVAPGGRNRSLNWAPGQHLLHEPCLCPGHNRYGKFPGAAVARGVTLAENRRSVAGNTAPRHRAARRGYAVGCELTPGPGTTPMPRHLGQKARAQLKIEPRTHPSPPHLRHTVCGAPAPERYQVPGDQHDDADRGRQLRGWGEVNRHRKEASVAACSLGKSLPRLTPPACSWF